MKKLGRHAGRSEKEMISFRRSNFLGLDFYISSNRIKNVEFRKWICACASGLFLWTSGCLCAGELLVESLPQVQTKVTVDGKVDKREWAFSAGFPSLRWMDRWDESDESVTLMAQYDNQNLYFAFQICRPDGAKAPRVIPEGETHNYSEDRVLFVLKLKDGKRVVISGNAGGLVKGTEQMTGVAYKARVTAAGWEGEVAIPCNLSDQHDVEFDFINEQATPFARSSSLGFRKELKLDGEMFKLTAAGNGVVVRFPNRNEAAYTSAIEYTLVNNEPKDTLAACEYWSIKQAGFEGFDTEKAWREIMREKPCESNHVVRASANLDRRLSVGEEMGRYVVGYRFKTGNTIIGQGLMIFKSQQQFTVNYIPFFLKRNIFMLDFKMKSPPPDGKILIRLTEKEHPEKVLVERTISCEGRKIIQEEELDAKGCEQEKTYILSTELRDGKGKIVAEESMAIYRPKNPAWANSKLGCKEFVPPPWTPLVYQEEKIQVWGRETQLGGGLMPKSLISQDKNILGGAMELNLHINGRKVAWKGGAPKLEKQTVEGAVLNLLQDEPECLIRIRLEAEFDGYCWYTLEIEPKYGQSVQIDGLELIIPLQPSVADIFFTHFPRTIPYDRSFLTEDPCGKVEGRMAFPFSAYLWVGSDERGLGFFSESDQYWTPRNENKVLWIEKSAGKAAMGAVMVERPLKVKEMVTYGFGLMASPIRPLGHRDQYWGNSCFSWIAKDIFPPAEAYESFQKRVVNDWTNNPHGLKAFKKYGVRLIHAYGWNPLFGAPYNEDPLFNQKMKTMVAASHELMPDLKIVPYMGWGIHGDYSFTRVFGREMERRTFASSCENTFLQCANGTFNDFFVEGVRRSIDDYGTDGIYLDSTANAPLCNQTGHGCGYWDGSVHHGTYAIRATRDLLKRLYKVTHGEIFKDKIIFLHVDGPDFPIFGFSDLILTGERLVSKWKKLEDFKSGQFRSQFFDEQFGLPAIICWHQFLEKELKLNEVEGYLFVNGLQPATPPVCLMDYYNGYSIPGYERERGPVHHVYAAMNAFTKNGNAKFYPYWRNEQYLKIETGDGVLGSFYENADGEIILGVCNLKQFKQKITIRLTPPHGKLGPITDLFLNKGVELSDGKFDLDIAPQGYRLLKMSLPSNKYNENEAQPLPSM